MAGEVAPEVRQTLAERLSASDVITPPAALEVLRGLLCRVAVLHQQDLLHLGITPEAVILDPDGIELQPAENVASLEPWRELFDGTAEEQRRWPKSLPTDTLQARQLLKAKGLAIDPCILDLLAVGDVFCRMLTCESASKYRQSVHVKNRVPKEIRPILDRMLGIDGKAPFASAETMLDYLNQPSTDAAVLSMNPSMAVTEIAPATAKTAENDTSPTGIGASPNRQDTDVKPNPRSLREASDSELPFQKLGHFEIQARIGHGGMGDVYRAYERSLDRTVAIKVLPAEFARQPDFIRRFQAEATAAARLIHPNIIQIYFIGEDAGHHYFAMQYVDGVSLASQLERTPKLHVNATVALVEQVLFGLEEAHALGFVHRDIKPGNILIDQSKKRALLADFGLVKMADGTKSGMTATGVILGTVDYISPEQARGKDVDCRSDLYAIGVLMYRLLSGLLPFEAESATALIFKHVYEQPRPLTEIAPHVPDELAAIVERLMKKDPQDRYQSTREVLTDLEAFRQERPLQHASADRTAAYSEGAGEELVRRANEVAQLALDGPVRETAGLSISSAGQRWWNRWRARFQQHAPQALLDLQNTQQQLEGGLAVYATRRDDLESLVAEAQNVRDELAGAAQASRGQPDESVLQQQLAEQDEQLAGLKVQLAKVNSTWQQLISQRDLLNARLKSAGARRKADGHIEFRKNRTRNSLVIATLLLLAAGMTVLGIYGIRSLMTTPTATAQPNTMPQPNPIPQPHPIPTPPTTVVSTPPIPTGTLSPFTPEEFRFAVTEFVNAGGSMEIRNRENTFSTQINRGDPLPQQPFEIDSIFTGAIEHPAFRQVGPKVFREPILESLGSLSFQHLTIETSDLKLAAGCRNLTMLSIVGTSVDDEGARLLSNWPKLRILNFSGTKITEKGVAEIGRQTNLRSLICNSKINDDALSHLGNLQQLQSLTLDGKSGQYGQSNMGNIHGSGLKHLATLKNLGHLVLKSQPLNDDSMKNFPTLPNLTRLELTDTQIGDGTMELLAGNRVLNFLDVEGTNVTGQSLKHIRTMPKLQFLMWNNSATDDDLSHMQKMHVTTLSFKECKITGTGFQYLEDCQQLNSLNLTNNPITDDGLAKLPTHLKLTALILSRTDITDASIPHLQKFGTLRFLKVDGTKMTVAGEAQLKQALPQCNVQIR